jgi:carboxylesterase type B
MIDLAADEKLPSEKRLFRRLKSNQLLGGFMRVLTQAEQELERVAKVMGTNNANINAIVEKARQILDPDKDKYAEAKNEVCHCGELCVDHTELSGHSPVAWQ